MKIQDFLSPANVLLDVPARDKANVLNGLAHHAARALGLPPDTVALEIEKRDELGSTGIGGGVSIPHARLRDVQRPFGLFARLSRPVEFDAIDAEPVDLIFLLLLPAKSQLDQLNALAAAARKLREPGVLISLRQASDATALYRTLTSST